MQKLVQNEPYQQEYYRDVAPDLRIFIHDTMETGIRNTNWTQQPDFSKLATAAETKYQLLSE